MAIDRESLLSGVTRAAIVSVHGIPLGVSLEAAVGSAMVGIVPMMATGNLWLLGLALPAYGMSYALEQKDPRFFRKLRVYIATVMQCRTVRFWRGASVSPMPRRLF